MQKKKSNKRKQLFFLTSVIILFKGRPSARDSHYVRSREHRRTQSYPHKQKTLRSQSNNHSVAPIIDLLVKILFVERKQ